MDFTGKRKHYRVTTAVLHSLVKGFSKLGRYASGFCLAAGIDSCLHTHLQKLVVAKKVAVLGFLLLCALALLIFAGVGDSVNTFAVCLVLINQLAHVYLLSLTHT